MRTVVIGGTGHVGGYLVPRLVAAGHEVVSVSRQQQNLYHPNPLWESVTQLNIDRLAAEAEGDFGRQIRALQPDVVVDLICFTPASAQQLVDALTGEIAHFLHCGSIWVHGPNSLPATENLTRQPMGEYAINKVAIESLLLARAEQGFPATVLHPGHIVGPGWAPVNPQGHFGLQVYADLASGLPVSLPNLGMETLHHVHADDVAAGFEQAIKFSDKAIGESFHLVSDAAFTLRGYAESVASWFDNTANLNFAPFEAWLASLAHENASDAYEHIVRSTNCSIAKAKNQIGYRPRYTSLQAVAESLAWLIDCEKLSVPNLTDQQRSRLVGEAKSKT